MTNEGLFNSEDESKVYTAISDLNNKIDSQNEEHNKQINKLTSDIENLTTIVKKQDATIKILVGTVELLKIQNETLFNNIINCGSDNCPVKDKFKR